MRAGNGRTEGRTYGSDYRGVTENFSQVVLVHGVVGVSQAVAARRLGGLGGPAVSRSNACYCCTATSAIVGEVR
jgi:hypothetical protein